LLEFDEEKHRYMENGLVIPSVTQIIQEAGLVNLDWINAELLKEKADLGKKVHSTTELHDKEKLDFEKLHPILKAYLNNWIKFRQEYGFVATEIELQLFHSLYRYAGRIDRVGLMGKDLVLLDVKSGTPQKSHAIQTAGYKGLHDQNKKKSEQIKKRFTVYLSETGYKVIEDKNQNDWNVFLSCLTIYNFKKGVK